MTPKKQAATPKTVNRTTAANAAVAGVSKATTLSALVEQVERTVVESGAEPNEKATRKHLRIALRAAEDFGLVTVTRPTDLLVAPAK